MQLGKFRHKGLKALYFHDDASGLPTRSVDKLRRMLTALEFADDIAELKSLPGWNVHPLKGERKGCISMVVTRNWRLTFRLEGDVLTEIDFEDYH